MVPAPALERYAGRWHEIARYGLGFNVAARRRAVAGYTPLGVGSLKVVNSCRGADGSPKQSLVGWFSGGENARFKFRFVGDCWIIELMRRATHGHWWITLPDDSFESYRASPS